MFQNVITPCVEDREYSTKADSSREFWEKSFWIFKNTAKVFSNERIQGRCKDDNVDFENVEKLCSDWKFGVDTAENEPRKDPEKWTI